MTEFPGDDTATGSTSIGTDSAAHPSAEPPPRVEPPAYTAEPSPGAYNSTDILPASVPGSRRARREAQEAAAGSSAGKPPKAPKPPKAAKAGPVGTPSAPGRAIVPLALAIVSAVALAAGWMHLQSDRTEASDAALGSPSASASPTDAVTPSPTPTPEPSTSPSAVPSPTATPSATTPTAAAPAVDRSVPVVVLNATGRSGLAAKVAAQLRAQGWKVTSVGNWTRGGIAATTVYLNGHVKARDTIVKDFPAADGRVELPIAGMPPLRMVIVLGKDYPR